MNDRERTAYAAIEATAAAGMVVAGLVLLTLGGVASVLGMAIGVLGVAGLAQALAVGAGWLRPPGSGRR
jgi:hypothetical protein